MTTLREAAQQALEALGHVVRQAQENLVPTIHYGPVHDVMNNLRVALAQQAEPTPPDAAAGLVDDLCLLHMGWKSDAELDLHRTAMGRVIARAAEVRRLRLIEQLKAQVAQMEGNT